MDYDQFVGALNSGKIAHAEFAIKGYAHYGHCVVDTFPIENGVLIEFLLTPDGKETVRFFGKFHDDKFFRFGKRGTYTLLDVWRYIVDWKITYRD